MTLKIVVKSINSSLKLLLESTKYRSLTNLNNFFKLLHPNIIQEIAIILYG